MSVQREAITSAPPKRKPDRREYVTLAMRGLLAVGAVLLGAFIVRALTGFGGPATQRFFATWVSDAIALSAVSVCVWRALLEPRERLVWGLAGAGMACWALGNAYFEHKLANGASLPNPSPADLGYLAFYPLVYVAVISASRPRAKRPAAGMWLDGLTGAAACATVSAALVLDPVMQATKGESLAGALTNIAYPVGDLTLLAMLVVTTTMLGWRMARGLVLLAVGMAIFALADSLYIVEAAKGAYQIGDVLDAGWLVALIVMAAGATLASRPRARIARKATVVDSAIVPILAGSAALVVLILQPLVKLDLASLILASVTLTLVVARLATSLRETAALLAARAREASRDPLTGLGNRRMLLTDLHRQAREATDEHPALLILFDLDGFKTYNDTFGHNAGDNLLSQVAGGLVAGLGKRGRAYRIGGDEFCALLSPGTTSPEELGEELSSAMARQGEGFSITASFGCALAPTDGRTTTLLLRRADDEMYARKGRRRPGTERQVQDALVAALGARDPEMESHASGVARLAAALGRYVGLGATDQRALTYAAALHDIGKIAIPDSILDKQGTLTPEERSFVQTHPLIAQRIVSSAPSLGYAAQIVRSTQERWDGGGYPDGLRGEAIPLASRIIAVCNAFKAMTSTRPSREAMSFEVAIAELQRGAGSQFDPDLVPALIDILTHPVEYPTREQTAPPLHPVPIDGVMKIGRRPLEAALSYQADHDPLTGLFNQRRFAEELERILHNASRYRSSGALLVLDLDDLKLVNDLHGHAAGDAALKLVAEAIIGRSRASDVVGRLGGDEFGIALYEVGEREALTVADHLRNRIGEARIDPPVQVSIGITLFEGAPELVADDLFTAADLALFEAKQDGRDHTRVYRGDEGAALGWVQRIRDAIGEERFALYAQPIVDLRTHRTTYRELLVRMLVTGGELIAPDAFIPTAERFGLIGEIDRWVTHQGLRLAREGMQVSINLSAQSIGDPSILEAVREAARAGLGGDRVIFEITETAAMANMQEARAFAEELNRLGCAVALDDFGTGFGSFSYLKHLPGRYLKIDREFIADLATNQTDQKVVRSITDVGHSLEMLIIAEGVEDQASMQILAEYGVDYAQGVYLGRPERLPSPDRLQPGGR